MRIVASVSGYREDGSEDRSILVVAFTRKLFGLDPRNGSVVWENAIQGHGEIEQADRVAQMLQQRPSSQHPQQHADGEQDTLQRLQRKHANRVFVAAFRARDQTLSQRAMHHKRPRCRQQQHGHFPPEAGVPDQGMRAVQQGLEINRQG